MKTNKCVGLIILVFIFTVTMGAKATLAPTFYDGEFYELSEEINSFNEELNSLSDELNEFNIELSKSLSDLNNVQISFEPSSEVVDMPLALASLYSTRSFIDPFGNVSCRNSFWGFPWFFPFAFIINIFTSFFYVPLIIVLVLLFLNHRRNTRVQEMLQTTMFYEEQKRKKAEKQKEMSNLEENQTVQDANETVESEESNK